MRKRMAALLAALALALAVGLQAVPARAADLPTVKVDVAAANGDYGDYSIDDKCVTLSGADVVFELSGATNKQVLLCNSADGQTGRTFRLRLSGATLLQGIIAQDTDALCLSLEVPADTDSYVESIDALDLAISGGGSLTAECIDAGPASDFSPLAAKSFVSICDTEVEVRRSASASGSCRWAGSAVLSGNASVTFVSSGDYAPLRVVNAGKAEVALTLKDKARLYCMNAKSSEPSPDYIDGLQVVKGKLLLQDSSYLQADARPLEGAGNEGGCAVYCGEDIEVRDSAQVRATSTGWAISSGTKLSVSGKGAYVVARSEGSYGIYLEGGMSVSDGARIDAAGELAAVWASSGISVDDASMTASSETGSALVCENAITIADSVVQASAAQGCAALSADGGVVVNGSWAWIESGDGFEGSVSDSMISVGGEGVVYGSAVLPGDIGIEAGQSLTVPAGATLTIPEGDHLIIDEGGTLINHGTIRVLGSIDASAGTVVCDSHCGGVATCASRATCDVCHAAYGDLDPRNHASGLRLVEAVTATKTSEGNVAYWYCPDCEKCFSDEAGTTEVSKASTVVPRLSDAQGPATGEKGATGEKPAAAQKPSAKRLPATGDASGALPAAVVLLAGVGLLGAARASRQR